MLLRPAADPEETRASGVIAGFLLISLVGTLLWKPFVLPLLCLYSVTGPRERAHASAPTRHLLTPAHTTDSCTTHAAPSPPAGVKQERCYVMGRSGVVGRTESTRRMVPPELSVTLNADERVL